MDIQRLVVILQGALSHNCYDRETVEGRFFECSNETFPVMLLQIIVDENRNFSVRHLASTCLKNFIVNLWPLVGGERSAILPGLKDVLKESILNSVAQVPALIRAQLGVCLDTVICVDYPEQLPNLMEWVKQELQGQNVYGALFVLRLIFKRAEFGEGNTLVYDIVEETFPGLLKIFKGLIRIANPSIEVADLIHLICKIFWSSIAFEIPKILFDPNVFNAWMVCFLIMLEKLIPLNEQPVDPEQRKSWGWWKVKKWTVYILNRLYICFGDIEQQIPDYEAFAQRFQNKFSARVSDCYLNLLTATLSGEYLPDTIISSTIQYLGVGIPESNIYNRLQLRMDVLLFEIIFPLICFNDNDQILWDDEPHEYIRKRFALDQEPRAAAMKFLIELIRLRGKENLPKLLGFCHDICNRYNEAEEEQKPLRQKDGALFAIGSLRDQLKYTEPYKSGLELMLVQHVFPEFRSAFGHLRAKAAWVATQYADISFDDPKNFRDAFYSVIAGMSDAEFPVRVDSIIASCYFVGACSDLTDIKPIIPQLVVELIELINEMGDEHLVSLLLMILDKFGDEISPYAIELCQKLAATFWQCVFSAGDDEKDEEAVATECLRAIRTIILVSVKSSPEVFLHIEPTLLPIMCTVLIQWRIQLIPTVQEVFEEVLEMISCFTYYSPTILSLEMWTLWPYMIAYMHGGATEFFPHVFPLLADYISRGTAHFLTCTEPNYQQILYDSISTVLCCRDIDDGNITLASKLIQVVFQNCRRQVDDWVEPCLNITLSCMHYVEKPYLKCILMEVVAVSLYYNAPLALNVLQRLDAATEVLNLWFQLLRETNKSGILANFRRKEDKRVCSLGLTSLLSLPTNQLQLEELERVFKSAVDILFSYKDQLLGAGKEEDGDDMEVDGDDGKKYKRHMIEKLADSVTEPNDDEDPFVFFMNTTKVMQASDPMRFENLMGKLELNYHRVANLVGQYGEKRRVEIEEEKLGKQNST